MPKLLFTMLTLVLLATAAYATDLESLIAAAQNGDVEAQYELSVLYSQGKDGLERDWDEAEKWRLKAAEAGHAEAQYEIGSSYAYKAGTEKKPELYAEAVIWYEKAAAQGNFNAQYHLARMYEQGTQIPQNLLKAFEYYLASAQHNSAETKRPWVLAMAQQKVGLMYYQGIPGERDFDEAYKWLNIAAQNKYGGSDYIIKQYYENGVIKRNPDDVLAAAEKGNPYAQLQMIFIYAFDHEMPGGRDIQQAEKWFLTAEGNGVTNAAQAYWMGFLCDILSSGRNEAQILHWYRKAAEQGNTEAKVALADNLDFGEKSNATEALKWRLSAAKDGYGWAYKDIAEMYINGRGVHINLLNYIKWSDKAQKFEKNLEIFAQSELYLTGYNPILNPAYIITLEQLASKRENNIEISESFGKEVYQYICVPVVMKDYKAARKLLMQLVHTFEFGAVAQKLLGDMYLEGQGIETNINKAIAYYTKAAAGGYYEAKLKLAEMYRKGLGVEKDYVRAYVLAVEAYRNPNSFFDFQEPCPAILRELPQEMTVEQFAEAAAILKQQGLTPLQLN